MTRFETETVRPYDEMPTDSQALAAVTAQLNATYVAHRQVQYIDRQAAMLAVAGDYLMLAYDIHTSGVTNGGVA